MGTTVLDSIVRHESTESGYATTTYNLMGEAHAAAVVNAVIDAYPRAVVDWADLVGKKVTMLLSGKTMFGAALVTVEEATIFAASGRSGCAFGYLPKGKRSRGFGLQPERVLDVVEGYGGRTVLTERLAAVQARFPKLVALTVDRLLDLPERGNDCTLAVFGRWSLPGCDGTSAALWLLHSYLREDDIVEGVLYLPAGVGVSEHGSVYGRDLLGVGGEVVGFAPWTLRDAIAWTGVDHADVLARVVAEAGATESDRG
jgi:hypothetical protein